MSELGFALLALLAVIGSAVLVAQPLIRRRAASPLVWASRNGLVAEEKAALLEGLRELDFDYEMGRLTAEDYGQLQANLRRRAIAALELEDEQLHKLDEAIEQAVAAERARRQGAPSLTPATPVCPHCGQPISGSERFCPSCGSALGTQQAQASLLLRQAARPRRTSRRTEVALVQPRSLGPWLLAVGITGIVLALGVAWVVLGSPNRAAQAPIATLQAPDFHGIAFSPRRDGLIFVGTHNGLLASIDGGRTWGAQPVSGDIMAITHHPERTLEVYLTGHELFVKSDDGGRTWKQMTSDLPGLDIHAFAISPEPPYRMYAFAVGYGLYLSEDDGAHWERLSEQTPDSTTALVPASGGHPALYLATSDQGVLASEDGRMWRTANGFVNGALPTQRVTALAFDPRSGDSYAASNGLTLTGALYAGTDRGLFKSIDGGASWTRLPLDTDVLAVAVSPTDSRLMMAIDSRGQVFRSEDRGLTWPGK
jgi:photosystem II stability/assembly factor-like uncharacterized protein